MALVTHSKLKHTNDDQGDTYIVIKLFLVTQDRGSCHSPPKERPLTTDLFNCNSLKGPRPCLFTPNRSKLKRFILYIIYCTTHSSIVNVLTSQECIRRQPFRGVTPYEGSLWQQQHWASQTTQQVKIKNYISQSRVSCTHGTAVKVFMSQGHIIYCTVLLDEWTLTTDIFDINKIEHPGKYNRSKLKQYILKAGNPIHNK